MPSRSRVSIPFLSPRPSGGDCELTPLTAIDPADAELWDRRRREDPRSSLAAQPRSTPLVGASSIRRSAVKRKASKWRVYLTVLLLISVLSNVGFASLFIFLADKLHTCRCIVSFWDIVFNSSEYCNGLHLLNSTLPSPH
jgi:hypothetical protein